MREINILILSVGRRVELVKLFKKALKELNIIGKVIGADIDETAPGLQFVDKKIIIEKISSDKYIDNIITICEKEKISLIIPTIDTELIKLAENKYKIEKTGAVINISDLEIIKICRDKYNTQKFFEENGFGVPKLINFEKGKKYNYPLFIKPLNGSSSINTFKINNYKELEFFMEYVKEPILQEFIEGKEFTVDVFCDFEGNPITIVPRLRITTRAGEISKGLIVKDREIIDDILKMIKILKPKGHITIQCMKTNEGIKYIEINPRFGGGAPMSIVAGANSCKSLIKILSGEKLIYTEEYKDNFKVLRYDSAVFIDSDGYVRKKI